MKLLGYLLCFMPFVYFYAQEAEVSKIGEREFTFNHTIALDEARIQRMTARILTQCPELSTIDIQPTKCTILFKEGTTEEQQQKTTLFCVTRFRYLSYKLRGK